MVLADVRVLRRIDDVAAVRELGAEGVVGPRLRPWIDDVLWPAFEAMLADDHRPVLAGLQVFRHKQDAVGEDVRIEIERDFVAFPFRLVVDQARARVHRHGRRGQLADDLFPELLAEVFGRFLVLGQRRQIEPGPEAILTVLFGVPHELLREGDKLVELAFLAVGDWESLAVDSGVMDRLIVAQRQELGELVAGRVVARQMADSSIPGPFPFGLDRLDHRDGKTAGGGSRAAGASSWGSIEDRPTQIGVDACDVAARHRLGFCRKHTRYGEPIQLRSPELAQVAPDIAVDRLGPHRLGRTAVAHRNDILDPFIDGPG